MDSKKRKAAVGVIAGLIIIIMIVILILLIPIEKRNTENEKYGELAVAAETDDRARYIIDNIEEYPNDILQIYYNSYDEYKDEVLEFVYGYVQHKNDYASMSYTDEELNSEEPPCLYMNDTRWAYEKIGDRYIHESGCATVSITMAYLYLTHQSDINPKIIADLAEKNNEVDFWDGINSLYIKEICETIGLNCTEFNFDKDSGGSGEADLEYIKNAIDSGHVIIAGMVGETFGGHALIIRQANSDGTIYINDPANPENSEKEWSFDELKPEIYYIWDLSYSK